MTAPLSIPGPNTIAGRIYAWLQAHPDEVLSFDDLAIKFGVDRKRAVRAVMHLKAAGLVGSGTCVWLDPDRLRTRDHLRARGLSAD